MDIKGQIFSPDADFVKTVTYPVDTNSVSVFIFYSPPGTSVSGSLSASLVPDSTYTFQWLQYNAETDTFDIVLLTQTGVSLSVIDNLEDGGYQVHITNSSGTDTSITAWLHIDKMLAKVEKDNDEKLKQGAYTCDLLTLSGTVTIDTFYYYDPVSKEPVRLQNGFTFLWTSDNEDLRIPNASRILDPNTTYSPPYLDTWYILTAVDSFGLSDVDSVFYESVQVNAKYRFEIFDKKDSVDFIKPSEPYEWDSPLKVRFINESTNGHSYTWIFSDSLRSGYDASEYTLDFDYQPEYMYKIPKEYFPILVDSSEYGCTDTFKLESPIKVMDSKLEIPNVFSPDGNGQNDFFKVSFQSMKEFSLRIYDRAGKMVYRADVTDMYKWEGWDGKVLDSDRDASPGAYFYVIEATGWDMKYYHKGTYRGVVYLYRNTE